MQKSTRSRSANLSSRHNNPSTDGDGTDVSAVSFPKSVSISLPHTNSTTAEDGGFDEFGMSSGATPSGQGSASLRSAGAGRSSIASSTKEPITASSAGARSTISGTHPATASPNGLTPNSLHLPKASRSRTPLKTGNHGPPSNKADDPDNVDGDKSRPSLLSDSEKRLAPVWNLHNVKHFTEDYNGDKEDLSSMWKSNFGTDIQRPMPYEQDNIRSFHFLPITKSELYIDILRNPSTLSTEKLYAATSNAAQALKVWQDEYLAIEKLLNHATHQPKKSDPRRLLDPRVFEDKKEAMLYGYKHDPKETSIGIQDPFLQGGFKPNTAQTRKILANTANPENPDGWTPTVIDGVEYIPGIRPSDDKPSTRRRGTRTDLHSSEDRRSQRTTRYNGVKHPTTMEVSDGVAPPHPPTVNPPRKRRGRPPAREKAALAQQAAEGNPPVKRRYRKRNRTSTVQSGSNPSPAITSPPLLHPPEMPPSTSAPHQPQLFSGPGMSNTFYNDPLLDAKSQEKIQQSRNPRRTEAMIRHWAKFNSEGRTRNPKRTKAQIEAAKTEADKQQEGTGSKRKRSKSTKAPMSSEIVMPMEDESSQDSNAEITINPFAQTITSGQKDDTMQGDSAVSQSSTPPPMSAKPLTKQPRLRPESTIFKTQNSPPFGEFSSALRPSRFRASVPQTLGGNPQNTPTPNAHGPQPPLPFEMPYPASQAPLTSKVPPVTPSHVHPHPQTQSKTLTDSHSYQTYSFHTGPNSNPYSTPHPAPHQHAQVPPHNPVLLSPPKSGFINIMPQQR